METPEYIHAEKTALRLIARAEQCSAGLARKLEKRGCDEACTRKVISRLTELNLLDDCRFARLWLQSRLHFTRTPKRLLSSLCARGIGRYDAQAALKDILDKEAELALIMRYVKKYARKAAHENGLRSLKFLLKNEGFSTQAIQSFLETESSAPA